MIKQAPNLPRVFAIAAFTISCVTLFLWLWVTSEGPVPLKPQGYRFHVLVPEAVSLDVHSDVRVSGVKVGSIVDTERATDPALRRLDVTVELDRRYAPIHRDARVSYRVKSVFAEAYLELRRGTPRGAALPEGGYLPVAAAKPVVQVDEIVDDFDRPTRRAFQRFARDQAAATRGRGRSMSDALGNAPEFLEDGTALLEILEGQQEDVSALLRNGGAIAGALADRGDRLQALSRNTRATFAITARRSADLRALFRTLPGFQDRLRTTLDELTTFSVAAAPQVRRLRQRTTELSPMLVDLIAVSPYLRTVFEALVPVSRAGRRGLPAVGRILRELAPALGDADPFLRSLNPALLYLSAYRADVMSFVTNGVAATQATASPNTRATPMHYVRGMISLSPQVLGPAPRRYGYTRTAAYPPPGWINGLASGLTSFRTEDCGASNPVVTDEPNFFLSDRLRTNLRNYVYAGQSPENVPAPPCSRQWAYVIPGVGTVGAGSFPRLTEQPARRAR